MGGRRGARHDKSIATAHRAGGSSGTIACGTANGRRPSAVTHTACFARTALFAEWPPFVVGQATRLTTHLTHTGERFRPFEDGRVTLALTVGEVKVSTIAEAP